MTLSEAIKRREDAIPENVQDAISNALGMEVADALKEWIVRSAYINVYSAYTPEFYSRRYQRGGIADINQIEVSVSGTTLTVQDNAGWQHLYGGRVPSERLAEALASGDSRFHFEKAGARPFHDDAKTMFLASGEAEVALKTGLLRQGIDPTGISFQFS